MNFRTLALASLLLAVNPIAAPCAVRVPVDVNTASAEQLQTVRGIGPAIAARIVAARAPGPFRDADDLQDRVRGLGPVSLRRLTAAGLSVPSVRIRPASPPREPEGPRGPEIIAGHPVVTGSAAAPACDTRPARPAAERLAAGGMRHRKHKPRGPA